MKPSPEPRRFGGAKGGEAPLRIDATVWSREGYLGNPRFPRYHGRKPGEFHILWPVQMDGRNDTMGNPAIMKE